MPWESPEDIVGFATLYMRIYFLGTIANLIYNIGSGILRAVGDSKRPLYFLIASCFTNIILDIVFVVYFHMGIAGAALATIISQCVSAFLVIWVLVRTSDMYQLHFSKLGLDMRMLKRIVRIVFLRVFNPPCTPLPTSSSSPASTAWEPTPLRPGPLMAKIDVIFWMIISCLFHLCYYLRRPELRGWEMDRVRKGIRVCLGMSFVTTLFLSLFLYNFGQYIFQIFTTDPAVLTIGMDVLHYLVPTFFTYIIIEIYSGSLKGIGDSWFPMFLTMTGVCALRVLWLLLYVPSHHNIHAIIFTYPMTWVVTSILFLIYFHGFSPMRKIR